MLAAEKLMEEIKLYWTIQIAVAAGLGFCVQNLMPAIGDDDVRGLVKLISVGFSISFFGLIGMAYNLLGGYFIYDARIKMEAEIKEKEDGDQSVHKQSIITPIINGAYIVIAGAIWANICVGVVYVFPNIDIICKIVIVVSGFFFGMMAFYFAGKSIYDELSDRNPGYLKYSYKLARFFCK
ncbi:MAG: hypothetical protein ACU836_07260 [Gammaproteobacteria bacterium]